MAPTETLATQHLGERRARCCADLGVRVVGLTNGMPGARSGGPRCR